MSGICGWIGTEAWSASPEQGLRKQAATLFSMRAGTGPLRIAGMGPAHGLAAAGEGADTASDGTLLAAVVGWMRFKDAALQARAAERGAAAVCLEVWRRKGHGLLEQIGGAFALALLDVGERACLLAVDRVGACPLAYGSARDGGIVFASTATGVALHPDVDSSISPQSVLDFAYLHVVPSPRTVFAGVEKLRPASALTWRAGRSHIRSYWIPQFTDTARETEEALAEELRGALRRSVENLASTVQPSATFLSGGIDSSTVTGLVAELQGRGRPAYTVGFAESGYDETNFARIAAQHFGCDLRVHYITADEVAAAIDDLAALYDEPFGNSSAVPALVCARRARADGIAHMLAGDGGDELFGGNARYAKQHVFDYYWRMPGAARAVLRSVANSDVACALSPLRKVRSYVTQASMPMPDRLESYNFLHRESIETVFLPQFLAWVDTEGPLELLRERWNEARATSLLDRMLYLDWKFTLADNDLRKVSATCQYAGVAVSFPWLSDELIELSTRVPASLKMRGTKLRYFVKRALRDFLPPQTIAKKKHGFGLPFGEWLKKYPALQDRVYGLLSDLRRREIFRPDFLDRLIEQHRTGHASYYGTMVWVLAMLEAWMQAQAVRR